MAKLNIMRQILEQELPRFRVLYPYADNVTMLTEFAIYLRWDEMVGLSPFAVAAIIYNAIAENAAGNKAT